MRQVKTQRRQEDIIKTTIAHSDLNEAVKTILKEMLEHYRRDVSWQYASHFPLKENILSLFCDNVRGEITIEIVEPCGFSVKKSKTLNAADFIRFVGVVEGFID